MERRQKICIVVKAFLEHPTYTMVELAELPELKAIKIARKTIPKYLNDPVIINLFGADTYNKVQKLLMQNRAEINKRKAANLTHHKSMSSKEQNISNPVCDNHVLVFARIKLRYPNMTAEELTELYNKNNDMGEQLDVDYVIKCLSQESKEFVASKIIGALEQKASEGKNVLTEIYKK